MLAAVALTTLLWATLSYPPLTATFGDPAIAGLTLISLAFGSGFLSKVTSDQCAGPTMHHGSSDLYDRQPEASPQLSP